MKVQASYQVMIKPVGATCNLDCRYCYYLEKEKLYPGHARMKMDKELNEKFIREYMAQPGRLISFVWQGGEPLMMGMDYYRRSLKLQKKYAVGKVVENSIQTNGTLLNDDWCRFLKDHDFLVGISIDGPEHIHNHYRTYKDGSGSFAKVMRGIELLRKYDVKYNTLSVVNDHNAHFPLEVYRFLKDIGSGFMQFLPVVEQRSQSPDEDLALVSPDYQGQAQVTDWSVRQGDYAKFLCSIFDEWVVQDVGKYYVQIFDVTLANHVKAPPGLCVFDRTCGMAGVLEFNGDVYTCDHFVYPENKLGNLNDHPLGAMMQAERMRGFGEAKETRLTGQCRVCPQLHLCHGGCPKNRIAQSKDGEEGHNYLCGDYYHFFSHVEPYMKFMAHELSKERAPANVMSWAASRHEALKKPVRRMDKTNPAMRNARCSCGSGKKYKNCCGRKR